MADRNVSYDSQVPFGMRFVSKEVEDVDVPTGKYDCVEQVFQFDGDIDDISRSLTTYRSTSSKGKADDQVKND